MAETGSIDLEALFSFSSGLYIVSSHAEGRGNGQIADAIVQVSAAPPRLVASINKDGLTHECMERSGVYAVSVLAETTPREFIGLFGFRSGRDVDKLAGTEHRTGVTGAPVVTQNALAVVETRVVGSLDAGTHTVFVGEVVMAERLAGGAGGRPLTYAYYRDNMRGRVPESAPGYVAPDRNRHAKEEGGVAKMKKYVCQVCGYVYDPEAGDPDNDVEAGTSFEDVPDDWVCPICGAEKDKFEPQE